MSAGCQPPVKAMEREVSRVPATRIGEGAKPGPNDGTKHINPVPAFKGSARAVSPPANAMESQVNSVRKGKGGGGSSSASRGSDFAQKREAVRKKKGY